MDMMYDETKKMNQTKKKLFRKKIWKRIQNREKDYFDTI